MPHMRTISIALPNRIKFEIIVQLNQVERHAVLTVESSLISFCAYR